MENLDKRIEVVEESLPEPEYVLDGRAERTQRFSGGWRAKDEIIGRGRPVVIVEVALSCFAWLWEFIGELHADGTMNAAKDKQADASC